MHLYAANNPMTGGGSTDAPIAHDDNSGLTCAGEEIPDHPWFGD